ncbi:MAG: hypothetical protein ACE366_25550 [Bradymonadia bacterium]
MSARQRLELVLALTLVSSTFAVAQPRIVVLPEEGSGAKAGVGNLTLKRGVLDKAIAQGPQRLIASIDVQPHMVGGQFVGHQVVAFRRDGLLAGCRQIKAGDVLIAVNGESLARPSQFMHAWGTLAEAEAIKVELMRGDQPMVLTWKIVP